MKHLEVRQKCVVFSTPFLGVSSSDETLRLMLDILLKTTTCNVSPSFRKRFTFYANRNNLQELLQSGKRLNVTVLIVLFLDEKKKD